MNGIICYNNQTGKFGFYKSAKEAGPNKAIFRTFEEFETCRATTAELVYFYNQITGEGVSRFSDRKAGLRRIWKAISNGYQGQLSSNERITMSDHELETVLDESQEGSAGAAKGQRKVKERSSVQDESEGGAAKRKARVSSFAGKILIPLRPVNPRRPGSNGFRSYELIRESGGELSFEEFVAKGGRIVDLAWDIDHGFVKAE